MQRIFLAQEGYQQLRQVSLAERQSWQPKLEQLHGPQAESLLQAVQAGDHQAFLVNLTAGSQALLRKLGDTWILLGFGPSAEMTERAGVLRISWDGETAGVIRAAKSGFQGFTATELRGFGVPEALVSRIRLLEDDAGLRQLEGELTPQTFYTLLERFEWRQMQDEEQPTVLSSAISKKELAEAEEEIAQSLEDIFHSDRFLEVERSTQWKSILSGMVPMWALFPLPDQKKWATRSFKGPALIRGVAGSGKTSLAALRALTLARDSGENDRVLLVTPIKAMVAPLQQAVELAAAVEEDGAQIVSKIEVTELHAFAEGLLKKAGITLPLDSTRALEILKEAIDACRPGMPNITSFHLDFGFIRDEISQVIKARGLHSQPDYLALPRRAFGTPLSNEERRQIWRIYLKYQALLAAAQVADTEDLLLEALKLARKQPDSNEKSFVVMDDVQEVPPVGIRLLQAYAGDRANSMFMISDASQRLNRGGEFLSALGIELSIKAPTLRTNVRNTREILEAGQIVLGSSRLEEIDGSPAAQSVLPEMRRRGLPVNVHTHESEDEEVVWIVNLIRDLMSPVYGFRPGDILLVARSNRTTTMLEINLTQSGIPCVSFKRMGPDSAGDAVRICAYHECKGMDSKVAILTEVTDGVLPKVPAGIDNDELAAHLAREQRFLYTAMVQARDAVFLSSSNPAISRFVEGIPVLTTAAEEGTAEEETPIEDATQP